MKGKSQFGRLIKRYSQNLRVIQDFINLVEPLLSKEDEKQIAKDIKDLLPWLILMDNRREKNPVLEKELKEKKIKVDVELKDNKEGDGIQIVSNDIQSLVATKDALSRLEFSIARSAFLYSTSLMGLVSSAEWFLSQLLHTHFEGFPELVTDDSHYNFTYKDLKGFGSLNEARQFLVEKKVENVIRSKFDDWISYLEKNLGISTERIACYLDDVQESFLRRNLIVHNGGKVNNTYLNNLPSSHKKKTKLKNGGHVHVDVAYLTDLSKKFEIVFIDIAAQLWSRNIKTEDEQEYYFWVFNHEIVYSHILEKKYEIAEHFSSYIMKNKKIPEINRIYLTMNYYICLKEQGRLDEVRSEIEAKDFSAANDLIKLAKLALLDKNKEFFELLPHVLEPNGKLSVEEFKEWPVFNAQRRSRKKCKEILEESLKKKNKIERAKKTEKTKPKKMSKSKPKIGRKPITDPKSKTRVKRSKGKKSA